MDGKGVRHVKVSSRLAALAALMLLALPAGSARATDLDVFWDSGFRLQSADGSHKLKMGGRLQNDWVWHTGDDELIDVVGPLEDGTELRRVRLYMAGVVQSMTEFKLQVDFAGGKVAMKDVFVGVKGLPVLGNVKVGHIYEPFGMEEQTSDLHTTFIERSLIGVERNTGFRADSKVGPVAWGAGVFRDADGTALSQGDGEYNYTARVTYPPVLSDDGRRVVHLGVAGSYRNPPDNTVRFRTRPENHLAPYYVDTGELDTKKSKFLGAEAALVAGSFSLQGEYTGVNLEGDGMSDSFHQGYYVYGTWMLTGEHRPYSHSKGTFGRVVPKNAYDRDGGPGAWELALRFSKIDLNDSDAGILGGELQDITAGLTWILNNNFLWKANYIHADLKDAGKSNAFIMRFQADF